MAISWDPNSHRAHKDFVIEYEDFFFLFFFFFFFFDCKRYRMEGVNSVRKRSIQKETVFDVLSGVYERNGV